MNTDILYYKHPSSGTIIPLENIRVLTKTAIVFKDGSIQEATQAVTSEVEQKLLAYLAYKATDIRSTILQVQQQELSNTFASIFTEVFSDFKNQLNDIKSALTVATSTAVSEVQDIKHNSISSIVTSCEDIHSQLSLFDINYKKLKSICDSTDLPYLASQFEKAVNRLENPTQEIVKTSNKLKELLKDNMELVEEA